MVKKYRRYKNRKIYSMDTHKYVILLEILRTVQEGYDVQIIENGEDITIPTLSRALIAYSKPEDSVEKLFACIRAAELDVETKDRGGNLDRKVISQSAHLAVKRQLNAKIASLSKQVKELGTIRAKLFIRANAAERQLQKALKTDKISSNPVLPIGNQ